MDRENMKNWKKEKEGKNRKKVKYKETDMKS
jgi:hypothetical protein